MCPLFGRKYCGSPCQETTGDIDEGRGPATPQTADQVAAGHENSSESSSEHASGAEWGAVFALLGPGDNASSSPFSYNASDWAETPVLFDNSSEASSSSSGGFSNFSTVGLHWIVGPWVPWAPWAKFHSCGGRILCVWCSGFVYRGAVSSLRSCAIKLKNITRAVSYLPSRPLGWHSGREPRGAQFCRLVLTMVS